MPVLRDFSLPLTIDAVLRAQGIVVPEATIPSPRLIENAQRAIKEGSPLLQPAVAYCHWKVKSIQHERMLLDGGAAVITGKAIVGALSASKQVTAVVCTIGGMLEEIVSDLLPEDIPFGLAMDGVGTAAVEALLESACAFFGEEAARRGWQSTIPFSPGMQDWPAGPAQKQVFSLVDADEIGVTLTQSIVMRPLKSLSALIGFGAEVEASGHTCDYCGLRETCRHKDRYQ
jgi:hypothetical protein